MPPKQHSIRFTRAHTGISHSPHTGRQHPVCSSVMTPITPFTPFTPRFQKYLLSCFPGLLSQNPTPLRPVSTNRTRITLPCRRSIEGGSASTRFPPNPTSNKRPFRGGGARGSLPVRVQGPSLLAGSSCAPPPPSPPSLTLILLEGFHDGSNLTHS